MAAPLLVPLILLGGATVALAAASSKKKATPLPPPYGGGGGVGRSYTLDANIPSPVRDQVLAALTGEQDPARLEAFAAVLQPSYPLAATALRTKAAMLRPPPLPYPSVPAPMPAPPAAPPPPVPFPPAPAPPSPDWQTQLLAVPDPPRSDVVRQLMGQNDPAALEAYARALEAQYPIAAWVLRVREAALRGMAPPPEPAPIPPPPSMPVPMPVPVPSPTIQPAPTPSPPPSPTPPVPGLLGGLDPGMPSEMQKAVVGALTTESDPAKLEGFASAIQGQYPVSAGLLMAKAEALRLSRPVGPSPIPTPPGTKPPAALPPGPPPSPLPSPGPVPTSGAYTVLAGDFPIKIAQKLVHDGGRWKELVAANPNKKRAPDGNFATLLPGEVLHLPASWVDANAAKAPVLSLPMGGAHASHP